MKPKPFMSLVSVMFPGPSLKWFWISSLVTAGRIRWLAEVQKGSYMASGPSDLLSWLLIDQGANFRRCVHTPRPCHPLQCWRQRLSTRKGVEGGTKSGDIGLHTVTRKITQVQASGGNVSSRHVAKLSFLDQAAQGLEPEARSVRL